MSIIKVDNLNKDFKIPVKEAGLAAAFKNLIKPNYTIKNAVKDFSLEISKGEFIGLLGPNGAGKTTLMKMLTGIIPPSSGVAEVLGHEPFKRPLDFRKKISLVMGQKSQLWWDIPAIDSFELLAKYYDISESNFKERLDELSDSLDISHVLNTPVRKLSLGERMKMELTACLLHNPEVIFLDEPTIGLDLVAQENIRKFLKKYQQERQCTILLTSHYMADIVALCERIVLVLDGQKKFDGSLADFNNLLGQRKQLNIRFKEAPNKDSIIFADLNPNWSEDSKDVELQVPIDQLTSITIEILKEFPVQDFGTEKLAIEKVMKMLIQKEI